MRRYIINLENYRICRQDKRNLVIQRLVISGKYPEGRWATKSYHGNSLKSLISGLSELIVSPTHTPEDVKLLDALETLRLELADGVERLETMLENMEIQRMDLSKDKQVV